MAAVLGISTGREAISLALVAMLDGTSDQVQTVPVSGNHVQNFAECIGVAFAADPSISTIGICIGKPEHTQPLVEALRAEGITNFRIVDEQHALAAYRRLPHDGESFAPAAEVLALGAAAYARHKGPVRGVRKSSANPRRIPGGPVAAAAAVVVCATAVTLGYAQNELGGALDKSLGGPTSELPAPPNSKPRPLHIDIRQVGNVTKPDLTTEPRYQWGGKQQPVERPLEVMMPDGKVFEVKLPKEIEPPRNVKSWLQQFLTPGNTPVPPPLPLPLPPPAP